MQIKSPDELIDTLMGFDHREFQRQMTDGFAQWHQRRLERRAAAKLYLKSLAFVALIMLPSYHLGATSNYRLSNGMTYSQAIDNTDTLLGL